VAKKRGEQVAHKTPWAAVKRKYEKEGDIWVEK
jgi:cation transport regulator ChaB